RKRLRAIIKHAYENVPYYHNLFKEAKVDLDSINEISDLQKLPINQKSIFKKQPPELTVSSGMDIHKLKKVRTSGSTGTPFEVYINSSEDAWRKSIYMRANIKCGQRLRDHWVVLTAPTHFHDVTNLQRKFGLFSQTVVSLFESTDQKIRQVEAAKPDILDGYSASLVLLAKEVKRRGLKTINPRIVFGNAEFIDYESRHYIEDVFKAPYCDQFGCAELDRTAWQCLNRESYHMDVDSVITEFLDKEGNPVSEGERGEIVYTSLFNFTMPIIRYAIGDVGVPTDDTCSCGVTLPLMKIVEGRKDSFLTLPGGRVLSPFIFNFAINRFKYYADIDMYRIHQKKIDYFEIEMKMHRYPIEPSILASEFVSHLKSYLEVKGDEVEFKISFVDEIPMPKTGKLNSVFSDLKAEI
ncbi:MAG: Phenylacetate--CoA ligase family protein, partial [Thermoproteota archaeon]|nr:Phenylacetate--CoA ligase family protein [Thermoproteota archaeon]